MFGLGTMELVLIFGVIILLFGAAKLPELARGTGRALRIFKTETKGLIEGDDDGVKDSDKHPAEKEIEARNAAAREAEIQATREPRDTTS
ncbi:Sec-independent protein translocase subunit TatA [Nocardioides lentus]|uniref:Sec-independent protein translocase protein TatA n=1 Tax=Nocardioides lentus TaxID=338077 RepID=A0ABP5ACR7_9ACTN